MLSEYKLKKLPDSPGIYLFKNRKGDILYVGKATSLRNRVKSYFAKNILDTRGPWIEKMIAIAEKVDYFETDSVLEALILEAKLIKENQPPHNIQEKDDKSFSFVVITNENFPRILVMRGREIEKNYPDPKSFKVVFGPFPNGGALKEAMKIIRRIFPFRDKCIPATELSAGKIPKPCFNRQIGLCPGVCSGEISAKEYARTIRHLKMFFDGKKRQLLKSLEKDMKTFAKNQEFEKAAATRKTVFALKHIQDVALMKRDKEGNGNGKDRIEAYDIAHMGGKSTVGVMTVVENGEANPSQYRMFKIRQESKGDDLKALTEILERRLKYVEWPFPVVIVVDGGITQRNAAQKVLDELKINIPLVSVVKGDDHKAKGIVGDEKVVEQFRSQILLANSESHRFAIKYHKKVRGREFI